MPIIIIVICIILLIGILLYGCAANRTKYDRKQDDDLQMNFLKDWNSKKKSRKD